MNGRIPGQVWAQPFEHDDIGLFAPARGAFHL